MHKCPLEETDREGMEREQSKRMDREREGLRERVREGHKGHLQCKSVLCLVAGSQYQSDLAWSSWNVLWVCVCEHVCVYMWLC